MMMTMMMMKMIVLMVMLMQGSAFPKIPVGNVGLL